MDRINTYKCEKCDKEFNKKERLECHIANNACKIGLHKCKLCDKSFTTINSMYRHMKHTCKVKKYDENEKKDIYDRLILLEETNKKIINENKKLKLQVKQLKVSGSNNITDNVVNINNGVVNHITLVGYGKEDLSKLDKTEMVRVLQNGFNSTIKLTEALHFNPKYPEYHNIYISNIKDKYGMMFDGKNWTLTMKEDLINKIYEDKKNYIEENLDEFLDSLTASRKNALERWLDTDDNNNKIKEIKNQIKLLLYNNRKMSIKTQTELELEDNNDD